MFRYVLTLIGVFLFIPYNMARPEKRNVEYFPHYISHGAKMNYLQNRYGNDGFAVWFKIMERLAKADDHHINLNDELTLTFLADYCLVSEQILIEIIEFLVKSKWLHKELWEVKILCSPEFINSVSDAYKRRSNKCINLQDIELMYYINPQGETLMSYINPQSKEEYSRENNNKEEKGDFDDDKIQLSDIYTKEEIQILSIDESIYKNGFTISEKLQFCTSIMQQEREIKTVYQYLIQNKEWIYSNCLEFNYNPSVIKKMLDTYFRKEKNKAESKNITDVKSHFPNWFRKFPGVPALNKENQWATFCKTLPKEDQAKYRQHMPNSIKRQLKPA